MIKRLLPLLIGLSVCGAAFAQEMPATSQSATTTTQTTTTVSTWTTQPPSGALSEDAIKTAVADAGYKEVKGLKFKDGVWHGKARGGNKQWVKLAVGPVNGKVYVDDAPSKLDKDEVSAKLAAAGYQKIHDVEYEHGLWSADAETSHGHDVDLLVDPDDGSVVAKSRD
ncbi:Peptidase propeptide and ypeb domain-containing protein [Rhodanobacter sp. Root179]|uniref:PepSY domain-containing protein n=1 Tax=unclassified Rhodanobacter TaxID=2621553 RepID=UPI0006F1EF16|nr:MULTISPECIES: PepSY domain-containing protein [unclassified Rhodanobacter]KQZ77825.1 peptidase M4 [Rhodanobacter sp. Root561]KRB33975.1 peptidase M4 [Rhodanobacter sp. Root179]